MLKGKHSRSPRRQPTGPVIPESPLFKILEMVARAVAARALENQRRPDKTESRAAP